MTKRKVSGYAARQEINRAVRANTMARKALRRIIEDQPGPQLQAMLLARIASDLATTLEALREVEEIIKNSPGETGES